MPLKPFTAALRTSRAARGWTQAETARRAKIKLWRYQEIEAGTKLEDRPLSEAELRRLVGAFRAKLNVSGVPMRQR